MRKLRWALLIVLLNLIASPGFSASGAPTGGREVSVAAAADLNSALTEIAASFKKQTGITVKLSFGASGALAQQIQNGAPFDLLFSADMDYPRQLADAGRAKPRLRPSTVTRSGVWCCGFQPIRLSMWSTKE